jgi:hypothetical protein
MIPVDGHFWDFVLSVPWAGCWLLLSVCPGRGSGWWIQVEARRAAGADVADEEAVGVAGCLFHTGPEAGLSWVMDATWSWN